MWIFTKYGFFSAVCARRGDGNHGQPIDSDRIMVRARVRGHLEALMKRFPDLLGPCEIREFPQATTPSASSLTSECGLRCFPAWPRIPTTTISNPRSHAIKDVPEQPMNIRCTTSGR